MTTRAAQLLGRSILCLLPCLVLTLEGCKKGDAKPTKAAEPALTVAVQPAEMRDLAAKLTLTGAIAAWQPLPVSPAANGLQVVSVLADEGQRVAKGQVLAQLDDRLIQVQLADARARLASMEASLQKARMPSRPEDLSSAAASVAEAEARLRSVQADYDRNAQLNAEGGVSAAEMDAKAASLAAAKAAFQQARDRARMLQLGGRSEDVRMAEAAVAQARAAVAQIELQQSLTRVVAPASGLILKKDVLLGDVAAVGKAMFTLARDNRLEMAGNVAEVDMPKLQPGQEVTIASDALPGLRATGRVRQVSPILSPANRMATVRIDLPVGTGFKPGMFSRGEVTLGHAAVLAVPTEAVVSQDGSSRVFVVTDGVAHQRAVVTGDSVGDWTMIQQGLKPGEAVATEGAGFLKDGDLVAVAAAGGQAAPQGKGGR